MADDIIEKYFGNKIIEIKEPKEDQYQVFYKDEEGKDHKIYTFDKLIKNVMFVDKDKRLNAE